MVHSNSRHATNRCVRSRRTGKANSFGAKTAIYFFINLVYLRIFSHAWGLVTEHTLRLHIWAMNSVANTGKKPALCRYFVSSGTCFYGEDCQFLHSSQRKGFQLENSAGDNIKATNEDQGIQGLAVIIIL